MLKISDKLDELYFFYYDDRGGHCFIYLWEMAKSVVYDEEDRDNKFNPEYDPKGM